MKANFLALYLPKTGRLCSKQDSSGGVSCSPLLIPSSQEYVQLGSVFNWQNELYCINVLIKIQKCYATKRLPIHTAYLIDFLMYTFILKKNLCGRVFFSSCLGLLSGAASKQFFFSYACLVCLTEHDYFS